MNTTLRTVLLSLVAVAFAVALGAMFWSSIDDAIAGPDQCQKNCQNQHCPRGTCSDDQHQKRLDECIKKCGN